MSLTVVWNKVHEGRYKLPTSPTLPKGTTWIFLFAFPRVFSRFQHNFYFLRISRISHISCHPLSANFPPPQSPLHKTGSPRPAGDPHSRAKGASAGAPGHKPARPHPSVQTGFFLCPELWMFLLVHEFLHVPSQTSSVSLIHWINIHNIFPHSREA